MTLKKILEESIPKTVETLQKEFKMNFISLGTINSVYCELIEAAVKDLVAKGDIKEHTANNGVKYYKKD